MKILVALALFLACCMPACKTVPKHTSSMPAVVTPLEKQHLAVHSIRFKEVLEGKSGKCTATAVGPNALLTAQHCFVDTNKVYLDGSKTPTIISAALVDGNDHVIYLVDAIFVSYLSIEQRPLIKLEPVHMWGNPMKLDNIYRDGYFRQMGSEGWADSMGNQEFILPCYPGDSGSAILDETGKIIAVVTGGEGAQEFSIPLDFTEDQLDLAAGN